MTAFLAPDPIQSTQLIPGSIVPAAGGLLFCYQAGTSTKLNTYTDPTASTARANPIVLDSGGNIPGNGEVWITSTAKFVLAPFNDSDPPVSPYWTRDNYSGINNITSQLAAAEWVVGPAPTFVSTTSFTLVGDQTANFTPGRRVKTTNTAGTRYGTISTSVFGAVTTVTITNDSGTLDAGLSAVWYALINPVNTSLPLIVSVLNFGAKGDGVTDDTAAVVAFLLAISGKVGYMPAGTYKVTSTLSLTKNILLYGDGPNATIINYTGAGVAVQAVGTNDNWDSCIRGIKIQTTTGTHGLRLKDLAYFLVESVSCTGFSTAGFHLTGTAVTGFLLMIRMFNCRAYSNTGDGVLIVGVNALNQISIIGCGIQGNTGKGINFSNAGYGIAIIGNEIEGNGTTAELYLNGGGDGYEVSGNYFESSAAIPAIIVADTLATDGGSITGNRFVADVAITNAIRMGVSAFAHGWNVSGNSFINLYTNAINAQAAKNCVFGPNYCAGSIVHVTNISNSPTGITIFNANNRSVVTYSASMTPDCSLGTEFDITATNGTAFTINAPSSASDDMLRTITIRNAAGGALGAVTWDAVFKMSAWTQPANGFSRSITFKFNATNWVQISQTGVDVPN